MSWRPTPYTVTADPTLWTHQDLRTVPTDQHPHVVMAADHTADRVGGTWQIRVGPAYQAHVVRSALDQGDDLGIALQRGQCAETARRLAEGRWVPPGRDLEVARVLVEQDHRAAVRRARETALDWDTRMAHGLLIWDWAQRNRGAGHFLGDLRGLAQQMRQKSAQPLFLSPAV